MAGNVGAAGWTGRVLTGLAAFAFLASGVMKLAGMAEKKDLDLIGIPESMVFPLGILEIACALVYVFPKTAVLGAILLTGYMGGAILTHWRVGDPVPFPFPIMHITRGATLGELLLDLERQFPGIRFRMIDEQDRVRPHMRIFINGEQEFSLKRALSPDDEISIVQALSGG